MPPGKRRLEPTLPRWLPWLLLVSVVALAAVGWLLGRGAATTETKNADLTTQAQVLTDQRDATAEQATTLAEQVAAACAAGGDTAAELLRVGACQQAQQVRALPVPGIPGVRGPEGAQGPGPSPEQISGAVAAYLLENPPPAGRAPTPGEVATAVAEFLTANPPEPGRAPTAAEIADATATYFATNPVRNGVDGEPGRPPTAEEVRAAVEGYLAAHPPAQGPQGEMGPAGPTCPPGSSLQNVTYDGARAGLGCVLDDQPVRQDPTSPPPLPDEDSTGD